MKDFNENDLLENIDDLEDIDNIDEEHDSKKNRIYDINKIDKNSGKEETSKYPLIIAIAIAAITVIAVIAVIVFYKKPEIFTPSGNKNNLPFDTVKGNIPSESINPHIQKGKESYKKGYFNDAVAEFKEVIDSASSDKDKAIALTYLGIISEEKGDYDRAIEYFTRAIVYDKTNSNIYKNLSLTHRRKSNYPLAIENIKKAIELNPKDKNSLILRGNIYFELSRYKDAIEQYNMALKLSPDSAPVIYNLATALMKTGDQFSAIEYFKKAGTIDRIGEVAYRAYWKLGVIFTENNNQEEAKKYLKQAIAIRPNDPVAYYNLGIIYLKQKKNEDAVEAFAKAEEYGAKDFTMLQNIGDAYLSLKDYNKSLNVYNKILAIKKRNVKILSKIGEIFYKKGELDQAYNAYKKITLIEPASENARIAYLNMGNILDDSGKSDQAIETYKQALSISSKDHTAYYNLGIAYKHSNKPELAIKAWNESSRLKGNNPKAKIAIADYYYEKNYLLEALNEYEKIITKWPDIQEVHFKMATIYYKKNNYQYALDAYKRVIKLHESNELAEKSYINIAIIISKLKNDEESLNESIRMIQKALMLKPGDAAALLSLGIIYSAKEMPDKAIDAFYQAIKNSRDNKLIGEAYNNIGKNYYKKNEFKKALQSFSRGLEEDPANEQLRLNRHAAMQAYENELSKDMR